MKRLDDTRLRNIVGGGYVFAGDAGPDVLNMARELLALREAAREAVESMSRLPDVDGAYRVTCLDGLRAALGGDDR